MTERKDAADEQRFRVGPWLVEPELNCLTDGVQEVRVEPKVMQVLQCLVEQPGRPVTREAFMERVWGDTVVTDDVLARCIYTLRKIFGDDPRRPRFIETIRKTGYRLVAPVAPAPHASADDATATPAGTGERLAGGGPAPVLVRQTAAGYWRPKAWVTLLAVGLGRFGGYFGLRAARAPMPPQTVPLTTFPGIESDPALSPDGQLVAFAWDGGGDGTTDLYVKQPEAETPLRLTEHPADERSPAWSPAGRFLAFVRAAEGEHSVHVTPAYGGGERRVVGFGQRLVRSVAWSPDPEAPLLAVSAQVAPHEAFGLYLVAPDGSGLRPLTAPDGYERGGSYEGDLFPAFAPDGRSVAYVRRVADGVGDVFVVAVTGGQPQRLTEEAMAVRGLGWAPDGNHLVVAANRGGTAGLWRVPAGGGSFEWIATAVEGATFHSPSLAGGRMVYAQRVFDANIWQFRRGAANYAERRLISSTRWDASPDVAPGGGHIAFTSKRSGSYEIWAADHLGEQLVQLTSFGDAHATTPRWAPTADVVAFAARRGGQSDLYVVSGDGGGLLRLTTQPSDDVAPAWSQDGRWIYFASDRSGAWQIWKLPAGGGEAVRVTSAGGRAAFEAPDGQTLYFVRPDTTGIWAMPAAGGPERLVVPGFEPDDWGNWRVARDGLYFLRRDGGRASIVFRPFDRAHERVVASLDNVPRSPGLAVSPDGDFFLYTRLDRNESDVMLTEHFR